MIVRKKSLLLLPNLRRILLLAGTCVALHAGAGESGELYRWVDKDGKVHFGDRPPVGTKSESLAGQLKPVNGAAPTRREDFPATERVQNIEREYAERQQTQRAREQRQWQLACNKARKELAILKGPVYFVDAEGNESTISERQRVIEAKKLEQQIRQKCR